MTNPIIKGKKQHRQHDHKQMAETSQAVLLDRANYAAKLFGKKPVNQNAKAESPKKIDDHSRTGAERRHAQRRGFGLFSSDKLAKQLEEIRYSVDFLRRWREENQSSAKRRL